MKNAPHKYILQVVIQIINALHLHASELSGNPVSGTLTATRHPLLFSAFSVSIFSFFHCPILRIHNLSLGRKAKFEKRTLLS
jgi:hypothetical protein